MKRHVESWQSSSVGVYMYVRASIRCAAHIIQLENTAGSCPPVNDGDRRKVLFVLQSAAFRSQEIEVFAWK